MRCGEYGERVFACNFFKIIFYYLRTTWIEMKCVEDDNMKIKEIY